MINPDGYVYTWTNDRMWRKTRKPNEDSPCVGTDLNRNYDSNWGGQGASPLPCSETFRGPKVFSAEESAAQRDYLADYASGLELFLTFHSYSQVLTPRTKIKVGCNLGFSIFYIHIRGKIQQVIQIRTN